VRFGRGGYPNVYSEKLLDEWLVPVCAPSLYQKFGPLRDANDLRRYPLLHSVSEPWTIWLFDGHSSDDAAPLRGAVFDASVAVVRMAEQAAGLVLTRWSLVADHGGKLLAGLSDTRPHAAGGRGIHGLDPKRGGGFQLSYCHLTVIIRQKKTNSVTGGR
jgi:DNA-binding transcriptional LysR family regulator